MSLKWSIRFRTSTNLWVTPNKLWSGTRCWPPKSLLTRVCWQDWAPCALEKKMKIKLCTISLNLTGICLLIWRLSPGWVFITWKTTCMKERVISSKELVRSSLRNLSGNWWWPVVWEEWALIRELWRSMKKLIRKIPPISNVWDSWCRSVKKCSFLMRITPLIWINCSDCSKNRVLGITIIMYFFLS
jgi:hypothetical protein